MTYIEKKYNMMSYEKVRVVGKTYLLEIDIDKFKKVKE